MTEHILKTLRDGRTLGDGDIQSFLESIINGGTTPAQTGAFLMALAQRGETSDEILGAARVLRAHVTPIKAPVGTMDCCGTGGDHSNTLNISTAVAFVVAGCGVPVAKHGNRAASSQSGAADVLEACGINLNLSPAQCETALEKIGFCFLMAPHHHHVLKPLASLRRELGFRTIFNLLGPLANPAATKRQLVGVFDKKYLVPFAEVLRELGSESAIIVHGADGLDEITLTDATYCAILENGTIQEKILTPADFGLKTISAAGFVGGDATYNAAALLSLLDGTPSGYRDMVVANAAAALVVAGKYISFLDAAHAAKLAIDSSAARRVFTAYREYAKDCA